MILASSSLFPGGSLPYRKGHQPLHQEMQVGESLRIMYVGMKKSPLPTKIAGKRVVAFTVSTQQVFSEESA